MGKPLDDFNSLVEQDKVFRNLASAELVGCITLVAIPDISNYSLAIKVLLLSSIILFVVSILAIIRFSLRYEHRYRLLEEGGQKTVKKYSKKISTFAEQGPVKMARMEVLAESALLMAEIEQEDISDEEKAKKFENKIQKLSAKSQLKTTLDDKEGYVDDVLDSFLRNLAADSRDSYIKYLKKPLKEKHSRVKWLLDMVSLRSRRFCFYLANTLLVVAIASMLFNK